MRLRQLWRPAFLLFGFLLGAYLLWHLLVPDSTVLAITVIDAISGQAVPGARISVQAPGGFPGPTATTDPTGQAHFLDLSSDPGVDLRVQKAEYDLLAKSRVAVALGQRTNLILSLTPRPGGRLLVGLEDSRIIEIDTASLLPLGTLVLPAAEGGPVTHLLVHPNEDWFYAVAGSHGFLLDSRTGAILAKLEIEPASGLTGLIQTWGLSYDGQRLLVLDFARENVLALEASSGRLLTSSPICPVRSTSDEVNLLPKPQGVHWSAARFALDARTTIPLEVRLDQSPKCLAVWYDDQAVLSPDGRYLCTWLDPHPGTGAGHHGEEFRIQPIQLGWTHWVTRSLPAGTSAVTTSPGREDLYVLNEVQDTLTILAPYDDSRQIVVPVGEGPEALIISPSGTRAYVANRQSETISVVDPVEARVVHTIPLPGRPQSIALQDARERP